MQDDGLPAKMNDSAEDHGHDGIKPRCRGIGGYTTEAIAAASKPLVLLVLVLTRLPGVILMNMTIRGGLLGRDRMEPSMRIATDKRQGK